MLTIDERIGALIRKRRLQMGISQDQLAKSIGITFQQVQKYEKGVNAVNPSRIVALSQAMGVIPSYFFGEFEGEVEMTASDREALEMMKAFKRIRSLDHRRCLANLTRAISETEAA